MSDVGRIRERHTPAGKVRYFLDFGRRFGRLYMGRDALGEWELCTRDAADRLLERIRARVDDGEALDVVLDRVRPSARITVGNRSREWLKAKETQAKAGEITWPSFDEIRGHVKNYWGPWDKTPIGAIRTADIYDWATWLQESRLAPGTTRNALGLFRSFCGWLLDREEIERIPRFPKVTVPEHDPVLLTREQQSAVLEEVPDEVRGIFLVMADAALRPNEARALFVEDLADDWIHVRRAAKGKTSGAKIGPTKTGLVRTVPLLTDRLQVWLAAHPTPKGFPPLAFPSSRGGGMWAQSSLTRIWKAAAERAKVPASPVREGTRHSTATWLRANGGRLEVIAEFLGHTSTRNTDRYARPLSAELSDLRDRLA